MHNSAKCKFYDPVSVIQFERWTLGTGRKRNCYFFLLLMKSGKFLWKACIRSGAFIRRAIGILHKAANRSQASRLCAKPRITLCGSHKNDSSAAGHLYLTRPEARRKYKVHVMWLAMIPDAASINSCNIVSVVYRSLRAPSWEKRKRNFSKLIIHFAAMRLPQSHKNCT